MARNALKKLALLLPILGLAFAFLVVATPPQARAEEVNQCAGTMQEVSNNINANLYPSGLFPYVCLLYTSPSPRD